MSPIHYLCLVNDLALQEKEQILQNMLGMFGNKRKSLSLKVFFTYYESITNMIYEIKLMRGDNYVIEAESKGQAYRLCLQIYPETNGADILEIVEIVESV